VCIICTRRTVKTAQKLKRHVSEHNRYEAKIILPGRNGTMNCISDKLFNHRVGPTSTQISLAKFATKDALNYLFIPDRCVSSMRQSAPDIMMSQRAVETPWIVVVLSKRPRSSTLAWITKDDDSQRETMSSPSILRNTCSFPYCKSKDWLGTSNNSI